jgi:hypothetical protein
MSIEIFEGSGFEEFSYGLPVLSLKFSKDQDLKNFLMDFLY